MNHNKERFKSLVAINLIAWTAGGVFLYRNCNPMEEPLHARAIEVPPPAQAPAAGTSSCSKAQCVFELKEDPKIPREERIFWLAQIGVAFAAAREKMEDLECRGKPPLLTYADPEIAGLLRAIGRINDTVSRKYGYEPIPVSGPDAREQFRSVNRWLGREEDSPIDDGSLGRLDLKIVDAVMQ
jgi:hypothetical protein